VATLDDLARLAARLPDVAESVRRGQRTWSVSGRPFAWERPFTKADVRRFGDQEPPPGPIAAVRVADLEDKEAVLAASDGAFFTIPHFEGFAAVLIRMDVVSLTELADALVDGWLAMASPRLARDYLASQ
jgi:hypothetical protein